jgi:predicted benzoate:H+ symporter BenE
MAKETPNFLVRGILIGGALGAFANFAGLLDNLPRAIALGMVAGFFAGITLARKHRNK